MAESRNTKRVPPTPVSLLSCCIDHKFCQILDSCLMNIMRELYPPASAASRRRNIIFEDLLRLPDCRGGIELPVKRIDICGYYMVSEWAQYRETCGTTTKIWRTHIGRVTANDLKKGIFEFSHLGCDTAWIKGVEVKVWPGMGSNLVTSVVCISDYVLDRGVVSNGRTPVVPTMNLNTILAKFRSRMRLHVPRHFASANYSLHEECSLHSFRVQAV